MGDASHLKIGYIRSGVIAIGGDLVWQLYLVRNLPVLFIVLLIFAWIKEAVL